EGVRELLPRFLWSPAGGEHPGEDQVRRRRRRIRRYGTVGGLFGRRRIAAEQARQLEQERRFGDQRGGGGWGELERAVELTAQAVDGAELPDVQAVELDPSAEVAEDREVRGGVGIVAGGRALRERETAVEQRVALDVGAVGGFVARGKGVEREDGAWKIR